jgi:hypothetical protein
MGSGTKESVLSRWSRRKQEAAQTPPVKEEVVARVVDADLATPIPTEDVPETAPLTDADMPDIDTLAADSDFTGFMSPGVSDKLRNLALRKLFQAPVFNIRDGLDEYDEDYTSFEKLGDIVTSDMKHQVEVQERKLREALELEDQATAEAELESLPDEVEAMDAAAEDAEIEAPVASKRAAQTSLAAVADDNPLTAEKPDE